LTTIKAASRAGREFMAKTALEALQPESMKHLSTYLTGLVRRRLWLKVLLAMAAGLAVGTAMGPGVGYVPPATAAVLGNWLAFPGQLFLAVIQMIVIPLVFASIVRGLAATESFEELRRTGLRVAVYFVVTTAVATAIGICVALVIEPGTMIAGKDVAPPMETQGAGDSAGNFVPPGLGELPSKLITLLPGNPLTSMVESQMLQIVVFAIFIGVALVSLTPVQAKPMLDLLGSLQDVCMTVVGWAMRLAPMAVFGLLAQLTMKIGFEVLLGMAVYVATVLLGLALLLGLYLVIIVTVTGRSPLGFIGATREVLLLAFSTSSSAAVMPLSIKTAEEKLGVRPSISQFVVPLGATINMNGTALYQGVATIFLAQVYGIEIGIAGILLVVLMAVGASIGSPATPGVGMVILAMVLSTVGIPPAGIALIMGVDRILDMSRTAVNVAGDLTACCVMDRWSEEEVGAESLPGVTAAGDAPA
jgi:Na+/H+-dicarboxylate symporter